MKRTIWSMAFILGTMITANAQETIRYYGHGLIQLKEGNEIKGVVKYSPQNPNNVWIQEDGKKWEKYKNKEVAAFKVEDKIFHSKVNKGAVATNPNYFMELLVPEDYKIKVYRYQEQSSLLVGGNYEVTTEYFVEFPEQDEVLGTGSMKLMPFHKKGVKYVESCPDLVKKISGKESGYKIGMISNDEMKASVLIKVAEDYQNCN